MKKNQFIKVTLRGINEKFSFNTLLFALSISFILVSCTGKKSVKLLPPFELKPYKTTIVNEDCNYFTESMKQNSIVGYIEIIDGNYSMINIESETAEQGELQIDVKFRPIKKANKNDEFKLYCNGCFTTQLYLVDKVGAIFEQFGGGGFKLVNENVLIDFLKGGSSDCLLRFKNDAYKFKEFLKTPENIAGFMIITSAYKESGEKSNVQSNALSTRKNEQVDDKVQTNQDWDKVLADYEAYTDKYIKLLKKAKAGDASAMTEYMEVLQKAQEFQESLAGVNDNLTPTQLQKFTKIQMKLATAASDL